MAGEVMVRDARGKLVELFVVEYQHQGGRWRPHSIVTRDATWDACWSRTHGLLVHDSGSGYRPGYGHWVCGYVEARAFPGRLWTAPDVKLSCWGGEGDPARPLTEKGLRRKGLKRFAALPCDPFEGARNVEGSIEYCCICRDYLPDDDYAPCAHLRWDDDACTCIGSGVGWDEDRAATSAVERAIPALCDSLFEMDGIARVDRLRRELASRRMRGVDLLDLLDWSGALAADHRTASSWLDTLRASRGRIMRGAVSHTVKLIDAWLASKGRPCSVAG